jgi:four helix bundle protein
MSPDEFRQRTFRFGVRIVQLVQTLTKNEVDRVIGNQLLRSGTAVGANYRAAARAGSRSDFSAKIGIVEEECDETVYWVEVLAELGLLSETRTSALQEEANEILAITISSIKTARKGKQI